LEHYTDLEVALTRNSYTHGFICSPTAFHVQDLNQFLDAGIANIYLEKPVSHTYEGVKGLSEKIKFGSSRVVVGFDLHFDPGLMKTKEILGSGVLGKIYSANAFVGQYLPDWRPFEDHRQGMSASKAKGGGVMLDLVHEFDYLRWLLGAPSRLAAFYQNNPQLEIETEDVSDVLIQFASGASASIHLDYYQRKLIRFCILTGEKGTIKWDLADRSVTTVLSDQSQEKIDFAQFERNDRYVQIVKAFIQNPSDERLTSFEQALISLKMVLESKKSSETNSMIELKEI
jgi:predicted dehydrogenase